MKNIFKFLSTYKVAIGCISFIFLVIWGNYLLQKQANNPQITPGASFQSLTPGISTRNDVESKLGNPVSINNKGSQTLAEYDDSNDARNHEVVYEANTPIFIKEIVSFGEEKKIETIKNEFGDATFVLYGPDSAVGFFLFAYPEKGIAYIGNPNTGDILEVWYYPSTTYQTFKNLWARGYGEELQATQ